MFLTKAKSDLLKRAKA